MAIRKDITVDVQRMLENLKKRFESKKFLFGKAIDDAVFEIEKIKASLPKEMKDAASLTRETERILVGADEEAAAIMTQAQAKAESMVKEAETKAESILQQAQLQQTQMVDENEILRIAKSQSEEIRNSAERDAREMRRGADQYASDVLNNLENVVGRVLGAVERARQEVQPEQPAQTRAVVELGEQTSRERAKV
ncbi:MAG: hypothetical protein KDC26_04925 [Armatimonadetes bacterium]|nr:hypothetical protein [Armatimonadota bacterium]